MIPSWAQKRADELATGPFDRQVLVAYPQSRGLFALPIVFLVLAAVMALGVPALLFIAAQSQTTRLVALAVLFVFVALYGGVLVLLISSFRTRVLATPRGVEVRQLRLGTQFFPWGAIDRVEEQTRGYRAGAAVLVLASGRRIIVDATDVRRATLYNGHRLRDISARSGRAVMPWTEHLIYAHRAHHAGRHPG